MLPCAHADLRGMGKHAVSPEIPIPLFARCEYSQHKTSPIRVRSRQPSVVYIYMYFYFCTHPTTEAPSKFVDRLQRAFLLGHHVCKA